MRTGPTAAPGTLTGAFVSREIPSTFTFSNLGRPPPLFAMEARSERIVRTLTSDGGGGAEEVVDGVKGDPCIKLLFKNGSIVLLF
jgi:hypothetical protein